MQLSDAQLDRIADRFGLLAEPMRLRILAALKDGERSVTDLVALSGGTQANVSRHLNHLRRGGVVNRRKAGTWVYYTIADPTVFALCSVVCGSDAALSPVAAAFDPA
jgi:DNA-binding transcriptional ArsR family regulator